MIRDSGLVRESCPFKGSGMIRDYGLYRRQQPHPLRVLAELEEPEDARQPDHLIRGFGFRILSFVFRFTMFVFRFPC